VKKNEIVEKGDTFAVGAETYRYAVREYAHEWRVELGQVLKHDLGKGFLVQFEGARNYCKKVFESRKDAEYYAFEDKG